jgi:hypothetical protein
MGKEPDQFSEKEAAERRDAVIKRMLATPPKPHAEMKMGKKSATKRANAPKNKSPKKRV